MRYFLLEYSLNGIKSIDKEIKISFYNSTLSKKIDIENYNIKAIYGENGVGKSAIIHGIELYKNIMSLNNDMNSKEKKLYYNDIINKECKSAKLTLTYAVLADDNTIIDVYKHSLEIGFDSIGNCVIKGEKFYKLNATRRIKDENFELLFESLDGIILTNEYAKIDPEFEMIFVNTVESNSFLVTFQKHRIKNDVFLNKVNKNVMKYIDFLYNNAFVYFLQYINLMNDNHNGYTFAKMLKEDLNANIPTLTSFQNAFKIPIEKEYYEHYEAYIKRMEVFIKIFKKKLVSIDIKTNETENIIYCELLFNYGSYKISEEYESTGIKKLIKLFIGFEAFYDGGVLFVDEFDANLHDVYFARLVSFLAKYGKGQLIMTTHNISLMEILKKKKHSIDFLTNNCEIVSWIKDGNLNPIKLYKEGMIENSPFNISSEDYLKAFYYDKEY